MIEHISSPGWERNRAGLLVPQSPTSPMSRKEIRRASSFTATQIFGNNLFSTNDYYPWSEDPNVTYAWVADGQFDKTNDWFCQKSQPGDTAAAKDFVIRTAATAGQFNLNWGSTSKGTFTFDGAPGGQLTTNSGVLVPELCPSVSGLNMSFTAIMAVKTLTLADGKVWFGFGDASGAQNFCWFRQAAGTHNYSIIRAPTAGASVTVDSGVAADTTNRRVLTVIFDGSGPTVSMRRDGTVILAPTALSVGSMTVSMFTMAAGFAAVKQQGCHCEIRAFVFAPSVLSAGIISRYENMLIKEAA